MKTVCNQQCGADGDANLLDGEWLESGLESLLIPYSIAAASLGTQNSRGGDWGLDTSETD